MEFEDPVVWLKQKYVSGGGFKTSFKRQKQDCKRPTDPKAKRRNGFPQVGKKKRKR